MIAYKKLHFLSLVLVLTIICSSCKGETLFFSKHIENNIENYGTNLEFYENSDVFVTDSGESILVSLKTFFTKNPETGSSTLSFNFELSGFEANQSIKVKNANLLLNVNNGTLVTCELYDRQKIGENFYGETTRFEHCYEKGLNIKDQYFTAVFNLSGEPELVDITIEFTYDLMDTTTSIKGCKIVQTF